MQTDTTQMQIQKMLTTTPPAFSEIDAIDIASRHFGIEAQARLLVSERDQNFLLKTTSGLRYTLKITNHAEQLQVIDFQNCALLHVAEQDPSLPLPRAIPTRDGNFHSSVDVNGNTHFVRVLSWVEGMVLDDSKPGIELANKLGRFLARLGLALKDFDHPGSNPPSLWDMKRAAGLRDLLVHVDEAELLQLIGHTLDHFVTTVKPRLDSLRTQVIHNDMNLGNVLVDKTNPGEITGIIDFGDLVKSPLIIDLAVAASYQLSEGDDPLAGALPLIAGYHAVRPLQQEEISLLTGLIRTRLITSLLINNWRVKLFPENSEYLMTSHDSVKNYLIKLDNLSNDVALERINMALQDGS